MSYHLKIYNSDIGFPENWTSTVGKYNVMLSEEYFRALHASLPSNMKCFMVGIFKENELVGGALFQYIDFVGFKKSTKNEPGWNLKSFFSGILIKDVMILGNNMLTGQNGFYFDFSKVSVEDRLMLLHKAVDKMQREIRKTSLIIFKDYQKDFAEQFTGIPGVLVDIKDTIKGFNMIIDGELDHLPEAAFNLKGTIEQAIEAGEKMLAEA